MKFIVSACLIGIACRYDCRANFAPKALALFNAGLVMPLCPEVLGGLGVPRLPCERQGERLLDCQGNDHTKAFTAGALRAMDIARRLGCGGAILKARSPSCGVGNIYDGTFSRRLIPGDGVFTEILRAAGFELFTEEDLDNFDLIDLG